MIIDYFTAGEPPLSFYKKQVMNAKQGMIIPSPVIMTALHLP